MEEIKMKVCSKCGREFPSNSDYFNNDKHRPDGLTSQCKECRYNKSIFNILKEIIPSGFKKCKDCGEILNIEEHFKTNQNSLDGYYKVCTSCLIKRREKRQGVKSGYKRCSKCERELLATKDFFSQEEYGLDGTDGVCLECIGRKFYPDKANESWSPNDIEIIKFNYKHKTIAELIPMLSTLRTEKAILHMAQKLGIRKIYNIIDDYDEIKYKTIEGKLHKLCKSCERYLPLEFLYFPKDYTCTDGFRNVCKECKGENFAISDSKIWTKEEEQILIDNYEHMTNKDLITLYFPDLTIIQVNTKGNSMGLYKTHETLSKSATQSMTKEVRFKISNNHKTKGHFKGSKNPMYGSYRFGSLNPNYKGGVSELYSHIRRSIKEWKSKSAKACEYRCVFTGERFNDIHHLYPFNKIMDETMRELNLPIHENISNYTQNELQTIQDKCLEIHYRHPLGQCMKSELHVLFHSEYSWNDFSVEDFYEFVNRIKSGEFDEYLDKNNLKLVI